MVRSMRKCNILYTLHISITTKLKVNLKFIDYNIELQEWK